MKATTLLCWSLLALMTGCSTFKGPKPPSAELRASLGTVAVAANATNAPLSYSLPLTKGIGAVAGMAGAALAGGQVAVSGVAAGGIGAAVTVIAGAAIAVVGVPVGAAAGAIRGVSKEKSEAAEAALLKGLERIHLADSLVRQIHDSAQALPGVTMALTAGLPAETTGGAPDYRAWSERGIRTVLNVEILRNELRGEKGIQPRLQLVIQAQISLVDAAEGAVRYSSGTVWRGRKQRRFLTWASDDARLLEEEYRRAAGELGKRIADWIFVRPEKFSWAARASAMTREEQWKKASYND